MGALAWASFALPLPSISRFFLERALTEGGGTNVVNVIIVDFRGLDTLGEITVLAVAALVAHALLRPGHAPRPVSAESLSALLATLAPVLLPFAVLVSVFLLLRGHNQPGGGFIAGLVLAITLLLQYVARGAVQVEERIGAPWVGWIAWGLLLAGATGAASMLLGLPFLTSGFAHPRLPVVGEVPLASAGVFDLGVYLVVVGATILMLRGLALLRTP
jgi:multicomponent K+:H+ antiporter subunit A